MNGTLTVRRLVGGCVLPSPGVGEIVHVLGIRAFARGSDPKQPASLDGVRVVIRAGSETALFSGDVAALVGFAPGGWFPLQDWGLVIQPQQSWAVEVEGLHGDLHVETELAYTVRSQRAIR